MQSLISNPTAPSLDISNDVNHNHKSSKNELGCHVKPTYNGISPCTIPISQFQASLGTPRESSADNSKCNPRPDQKRDQSGTIRKNSRLYLNLGNNYNTDQSTCESPPLITDNVHRKKSKIKSKIEKFKICHINVRGLKGKKTSLQLLLYDQDIDLAFVSETNISPIANMSKGYK